MSLTSERLILRNAQDDDLGPLFAIFSNPKAMRYWSNLPHKTKEQTHKTLEKLKSRNQRNYFIFEHKGTVIGLGGIHAGTEIGFIFHPDHWSQGFASEALRTIIAHVWATTDMPAITADADPCNLKSVRLLTKLGFRVTGFAKDTFCVGGYWSDSAYFTLSRPENT